MIHVDFMKLYVLLWFPSQLSETDLQSKPVPRECILLPKQKQHLLVLVYSHQKSTAPLFNHISSLRRSLTMYIEIDCHCVICGGPFCYRDTHEGSWRSIKTKPGSGSRGKKDGYDDKVLQEKGIEWLGHSRLLSGNRKGEATK